MMIQRLNQYDNKTKQRPYIERLKNVHPTHLFLGSTCRMGFIKIKQTTKKVNAGNNGCGASRQRSRKGSVGVTPGPPENNGPQQALGREDCDSVSGHREVKGYFTWLDTGKICCSTWANKYKSRPLLASEVEIV